MDGGRVRRHGDEQWIGFGWCRSTCLICQLKKHFATYGGPALEDAARKRICTSGLVWVKDDRHEFYVNMKERGLWQTKKEAERIEPWEITVEVKQNTSAKELK